MWPPENYVGLRFSGPFEDSNFLGIFYAVMLILVIMQKSKINNRERKLYSVLFIVMICLSKSWSVIILLLVVTIFHKFIRVKSYLFKITVIAILYILFIFFISNGLEQIQEVMLRIMNEGFKVDYSVAYMKWYSLEKRFSTQIGVMHLLKQSYLGIGVKNIIAIFNLDTHNTYMNAVGEMGACGLIHICLTMFIKVKKYNKMTDILTSYIILQSMFVDIFTYPIYWFVIFVIVENYNKKEEVLCNANFP